MAAPQGKIFVPLGVNPSGYLRTLELDANDLLKLVIAAALPAGDNNIGNVDVVSSTLPTGASTLAEQQTQTTALQLIDDLRNALATVATDKLRASVIDSALPSGASTLAEQQTQTTALQLIDDLRNALATVATDKLRASIVDALVAGSARIGSVGQEGWIGAAWQKNPLQFGFSGQIGETLSNTALAAGTNTLTGAAVPAGEIWVVTLTSMRYDGIPPTEISIRHAMASFTITLRQQLLPVTTQWYTFAGEQVMVAGDTLACRVLGATLNDDLFFVYSGYRVDIDQ